MYQLTIPKRALAAFVGLAASSSMACGDSRSGAEDPGAEAGRVSLPLITETNGHLYRLSNAAISIFGPQFTQIFSSADPSETAISTTLQTGNYSAFLFQWTLQRDDGTGNFAAVTAELVSSPAVNFGIFNGATTTVSYEFQTDGVIVTVGSGALRVTATVDEIGAVCTPFGADCESGSWCPPTALTGSRRACIAEGATALGQPCREPTECVANASCFDLGEGPVCAALCPSSGFDAACDSGGICQPFGATYGVCRPAPEGP